MDHRQNNRPYVEIVEQPAGRSLRFRYICEGRSAGSISGINSTPERKTFPSIRIVGYKGRAVVVVSCVTRDLPYRPHPHNLVGKDTCNRGVCTIEVYTQNLPISFSNLGIQCVKKKEIIQALKLREEIRVDPYRNGFQYKNQCVGIDLNVVRLCFQVFLEGPTEGKFGIPLDPVVSEPIYDKKTIPELAICKLSHCSAPIVGGMEMIILCEKIVKDDIQVEFFETHHGQTVWKGYGEFHPTDIHKQTAISFKTPAYHTHHVNQPIPVFIRLRRPSDDETSDALPFTMIPSDAGDPVYAKRKRQKFNTSGVINPVHYPKCESNCAPENIGNNISKVKANLPNIPKNNRMSLLQHLQADAEKNEEIKNQLAENISNHEKTKISYAIVNKSNNGMITKHPDDTVALTNTTDASTLPHIHQFMKLNNNSTDTAISRLAQNYFNGASAITGPPNVTMACYSMPTSQSMCNQPPTLYNVTSQKQELGFRNPQPHNNNSTINYVASNSSDINSNQLNFDINEIDSNLDSLFSADLDEFVTTLSESFHSGLSITDTIEISSSVKDVGAAESNIWLN